jgi:phospholipid/cholesterol/gamma-HCH transport system substrate-binding protein
MSRAVREYARYVAVIAGFVVLATVAGGYIAIQERLRLPFDKRYEIKADFRTTQGYSPGFGQAVNVAGVRVGDIGDVELHDGQARATLSIDPHKLPRVYADAGAALTPNTAAQDLVVELVPGHRSAGRLGSGQVIPVASTTAPINFDELLSALDGDTRDWLAAAAAGLDRGTSRRGEDLRAIFRSLGPTAEQGRRVSAALAARRRSLERLVDHFRRVAVATGHEDRTLAQLVSTTAATVRSLADEQPALEQTVAELPATLALTRSTLERTTPLARELGPALTALLPVARRAGPILRLASPLASRGERVLREQVRPFVRESLPLGRNLAATTHALRAQTPDLKRSFGVLEYLFNELAYNPPGDNEGFLHWLAWTAHNVNSVFGNEDAHGSVARVAGVASCSSVTGSQLFADAIRRFTGFSPTCPPA